MEATYDPQRVESSWYERWESAGAFRPEVNAGGEPYCIVIPPPNVTGSLHMGHALDQTIQDVIIRRKRMQGFAALWLPGTDHAGIATQNVVERDLAAEGITRDELGREGFIEKVWEWKARYGDEINDQIRRMGHSTDWSRERFTMDEGLSRAVRKVFVDLYHEGLIYRGNRIINWCPKDRTAISDVEVEHEDVQGELVHIFYPFTEGEGGIVVVTTRAETMLGDTAVAVHPDDERYQDAIGRTVTLPLMNREIPIVADDVVDPDFGSGAVKVTPAHDAVDFEIAERHGLPPEVVLDQGGRITERGGRFAGLDRFEARQAVKQALDQVGALLKVEDHTHAVGTCQRCHTIVEPYLSEQWFVKVRPLVEPAIAAVESGDIRFAPRVWEKTYLNWMENLRDWTISRQIWWGHRIPVWYCDDCDQPTVSEEDPTECAGCGSAAIRQDPDVLDTWFSSGLFPFSTLGWPDDTEDLRTFYPNSTLVTGYDIISFWVARMIKFGLHFTGQKPFSDVVIHGLVRAPDGRKMSKSLGNAVDPLDVVADHGADPLRLALIQAAAGHQDVPYSEDWVVAARRFGNKVWNAIRFVLGHVDEVPADGGYPVDPGPESGWILNRLHTVFGKFDTMLEDYRFSDAYGALYNFAWSEVFDWYLELAKTPLRNGDAAEVEATLGVVMRDLLKLFHPVMPYVTEELWSHLVGEGMIISASWPDPPAVEEPEHFEIFRELVVGVRRFRAEHGLSPRHPLEVSLLDPGGAAASWWDGQFEALASFTPNAIEAPPAGRALTRIVAGPVQAFISLEGIVDLDAERDRLASAISDNEAALARAEGKLGNPQFVEKAPDEVVEKERAKAEELGGVLEKLRAQLDALG
jgi:valyl-tRNA synthetase